MRSRRGQALAVPRRWSGNSRDSEARATQDVRVDEDPARLSPPHLGREDLPAYPADAGMSPLFPWCLPGDGRTSLADSRAYATDSPMRRVDSHTFDAESRASSLDSVSHRANGCARPLDSGSRRANGCASLLDWGSHRASAGTSPLNAVTHAASASAALRECQLESIAFARECA